MIACSIVCSPFEVANMCQFCQFLAIFFSSGFRPQRSKRWANATGVEVFFCPGCGLRSCFWDAGIAQTSLRFGAWLWFCESMDEGKLSALRESFFSVCDCVWLCFPVPIYSFFPPLEEIWRHSFALAKRLLGRMAAWDSLAFVYSIITIYKPSSTNSAQTNLSFLVRQFITSYLSIC